MGVWSDHGAYGIADSLVFSVPVVCPGAGKYQVYKGPVACALHAKVKNNGKKQHVPVLEVVQ